MITKSLKKSLISSLCLLICMSIVTGCTSNRVATCAELNKIDNDGEKGRQKAINLIADAFLQGGADNGDPQFKKLDSIINEWSLLDCKLTDGRSKINFISHGFKNAFKRTSDWQLSLKKIQELRKAQPKAAYAIYAEAEYWVDYAWEARGNGSASTVTPERWRLFKERLTVAEKILSENKTIGSNFPGWYEQMLTVEYALDKKEDAHEFFNEGAARYKNYLPLYIVMRNYSEPKWGGSWQQLDNFISWASNNADASEREFIYARLYYGVRDNMMTGNSFFSDTLVDWKKLKVAYEELIKQNPDSLDNLAMFADLSCEANDKTAYLELRKKIGSNISQVEWGRYEQPEACDLKFGYSE